MAGRVTAVLGPTNTGKTHYAIERMLAHRTGVIGLPLRLLAREVYDRIVKARGPSVVALITGEERIVPERAAYWVATTEAMPEVLADFERELIREVHDRIVLRTGVATASELQVVEDALAAMDAAGRQDLTDMGMAA